MDEKVQSIALTINMELRNYQATKARWRYNRRALNQPPVKLKSRQRKLVEAAISETCHIRRWCLWVSNVRSKHVHAVVTANCRPDRVMTALKANATRKMHEDNCWNSELSPWAHRGSKRYLWTEQELVNPIVYVREDQGEPLE